MKNLSIEKRTKHGKKRKKNHDFWILNKNVKKRKSNNIGL